MRRSDLPRDNRIDEAAPMVTDELRAYASYLRRNNRMQTARGIDFLIEQLEGRS